MKKTILLLCAIALAFGLTEKEYQDSFASFVRKYNKVYNNDEFNYRFKIFRSNLDFIEQHNAKNLSFTVGINKFADMSSQEFVKFYNGLDVKVDQASLVDEPTTSLVGLPDKWDWNSKGAVTHVKNQEQCGSCWSFSTTGSVEGCHFITTGKLVSLSEQNLIDCSSSYGNQGCNGGLMTDAMDYIIANKGIDTEESYPYTAEAGKTCLYKLKDSASKLKTFVNVQQGSEADLQAKVYLGPTSVAIDASANSFQLYQSGVYYEPACSSTDLDHGVLAVGWGVDTSSATPDYWIVKNSWGEDWGQSGFIFMARNKNNNCGIATMGTLPEDCKA
eukprot:TRINITY_DN1482_c0_g1_i1.p1 TRINITY_DN1482_c0_g1~~TRINITY_DN1482_c0_g1_i1.p1  ORF type:complete len:331 (+),score=94.98 TRINITY_DN1482_c0_g1_i1:64-1056(+)